jgi:nitrate/nitrite-specific signal transduction histidine kinase
MEPALPRTAPSAAELPTDSVEVLLEELRRAFLRTRQVGGERATELAERIDVLERKLVDMEQLLVTAERQASRLANLYVAAYQLHASLDPAEVRAAVGDIAVNLLGAESCFLLLGLGDEPTGHEVVNLVAEQRLAAPFDAARYAGAGDVLVDASLGDGVVRFGPASGSCAIAVVPLAAQGQVLGALVLVRLLPHKAALHHQDRELLDLLGAHAASALLGAHVFHETQRKLRTLEGLVSLLRRT